jgi:hypothetical protein
MHVQRSAIAIATARWGRQWYLPANPHVSWRWDFDTLSWIMTRPSGETLRIPGDHPDLADADPASKLYMLEDGFQWSYEHGSDLRGVRVFVWVSPGYFAEVTRDEK